MSEKTPRNESPTDEITETPTKKRRRVFSWRNLLILGAIFSVLAIFLVLAGILVYRGGYVDNQIADNIVKTLAESGIRAEYSSAKTTLAPLSLEFKDFTLYDQQSGEKLAKLDRLNLKFTIPDWLETRYLRTIKVNETEADGLEVWVKFDENGRSNFANLKTPAGVNPNLKVDFASVKVKLNNGLVHYGDITRKLSGEARNVQTLVEPENENALESERRYKFNFVSKASTFTSDDKQIEPIDIDVRGIASEKNAEITALNLITPFSDSTLSGTLQNWEKLKYNLKIESTVDLRQTAETLKTGTTLRGFANLTGTVTGEGENWKIETEAASDALEAANVYLKGVQITGDGTGTGDTYEANAKVIAEMLNTGDFQMDMLQLAGKIRGTGADLRWFGELRAAAARAPNKTTVADLILSDAYAEYIDKKFGARIGNATIRSLNTADANITGLQVRDTKLSSNNGETNATMASVNATSINSKDAKLKGVSAGDVKLQNKGDNTDIDVGNLQAQSVEAQDTSLQGVNAKNAKIRQRGNTTDIDLNNLQARNIKNKDANLNDVNASNAKINIRGNEINAKIGNAKVGELIAQDAKIRGLSATDLSILNRGNYTEINSSNATVEGVQTADVVLGSVNVAGVRLKIVQGRIEGEGNNIDAGNVQLLKTKSNPDGGNLANVKLTRPVFVIEPSGRYRASMDLSLGGGVLGSLKVGAASAKVTATSEQVELTQLNAKILDGEVKGEVTVGLQKNRQSLVNAEFSGVDLAKAMAMQGGKVLPIAGKSSGKVNLSFPETNFKLASGTVTADFIANAGSAEKGFVPLNGKLAVKAERGLFNIDSANFNTEKSNFTASGRFDLDGDNSDLQIALNSSDAKEVQRLINVLGVAPELDEQLASANAGLAGNLIFKGNLRGNLTKSPNVEGKVALESLLVNGQEIGSVVSNVRVLPAQIEITDGVLAQKNGGTARFKVTVPQPQNNNISVFATLENIDVGKLLPIIPAAYKNQIPKQLLDIQGLTSGRAEIAGLPNTMTGFAEFNSQNGSIAGIKYDSFDSRFKFDNTLITIEKFETRGDDGTLSATGNYNGEEDRFDLTVNGTDIDVVALKPFFGNAADVPDLTGKINFTARGTGEGAGLATSDFSELNVTFDGAGREIKVGEQVFGDVLFVGRTENQIFRADFTAQIPNATPQIVTATLNFGNENLPLRLEANLNKTNLAPYLAFFQKSESVTLGGVATGNVLLEGNLNQKQADGKFQFTTDNLKGTARFSELIFQAQDVYLQNVEPLLLSFSASAITIENGRFTGADSNLTVSGTKALSANAQNNLMVDGKINLRLLNSFSRNTFFNGAANINVRLVGPNASSRLSGSANVANAALSLLVSNRRLQFTEIESRILFNADQAQIVNLKAKLGGGTVTGTGGVLLADLVPQRFRLNLRGTNVSAPLPRGVLTSGDADVVLDGQRVTRNNLPVYEMRLSGFINARRGEYTDDIDLADLINNRVEGSLAEGAKDQNFGNVFFDLRVEGRDALYVKNNLADLVASVSLRLTGDNDNPIITGRVTTTSGTLFYRNDRYDIQRGIVEFPPQRNASPLINLQATSDIGGYQVSVNLNGSFSETENLAVNLRSNPGLPQADIVSLITTGNLSNTGEGIPTLAQTGIDTAATLLTDSLINNPLRKATDKLFGLNKFDIDPILSGRRVTNPGARLTVGRQINRNLAVTYSTNLSSERNQVLALEYRVSNRLSFVAQYEQNAGGNVTQRDNFKFEVRFRKRF